MEVTNNIVVLKRKFKRMGRLRSLTINASQRQSVIASGAIAAAWDIQVPCEDILENEDLTKLHSTRGQHGGGGTGGYG